MEIRVTSIVLVYFATLVVGNGQTGTEFSCPVNVSSCIPESVHRLRPSDINVIAAIGDSLTAGMGIYSSSLVTVFTQYRGHSFTMGGVDDVETHTTLPNILKKFNEDLTGYSTGIGGPDGRHAHLNVAVIGERAEGLPDQARKLVERMKKTLGRKYETGWKVINLLVGGNDVCDYCKFPERFSPANFIRHVRTALDYFHQNVPRALVNLILPLDASVVSEIQHQSWKCRLLFRSFWCTCGATRPPSEVINYVRQIQNLTMVLYDSGRYDTRDDFTVVLQPFLKNSRPPVNAAGNIDLSKLAPDCFHFGSELHAVAASYLWRNMMEPEGLKTDKIDWNKPRKIICPTEANPYIFTRKNSKKSFYETSDRL